MTSKQQYNTYKIFGGNINFHCRLKMRASQEKYTDNYGM